MTRPVPLFLLAFAVAGVVVGVEAGAQGPASPPRPPHVVFVTGDDEYRSEISMPMIAAILETRHGLKTSVAFARPRPQARDHIEGLEALESADLMVMFTRYRALPDAQLNRILAYVKSGKPIVGFRTSTHAFNYPEGHPLRRWNAFGEFALGSPPGWGNGHTHYGHNSSTDVRVAPGAASHPVLTGVAPAWHVRSWLYHVVPNFPPANAQRLLIGTAVNPNNPNAVENPVAWTWQTEWGGRVFTTTLGHPEDFRVEPFQRLVVNGIHWALGLPVPATWAGPMDISVPYRQ